MSDGTSPPASESGPGQPRALREWVILALIGLVAGFLSGLFGVGGGVVIVPALVALAGFDLRRASGTSLAAIVPTSLVGIVAYAGGGNVDWLAAGLLILGAVAGAQLGTWLLERLSLRAVRWAFALFLVVVIVSLGLSVTTRDAVIDVTVWTAIALVLVGFLTGTLSGLLGVGGGVVVVPVLMLLFGASDLVAKGTSLLVIVPTAMSGTLGNWRRHHLDLRASAALGLAACSTTALGAWAAFAVAPAVGNLLFAALLLFIVVRTVRSALRDRP